MVDSDDVRELIPHYLAMLAIAFAVILLVRLLFGALNFWVETVMIVVALLLYRPAIQYFGLAPSTWTADEEREELIDEFPDEEEG